jgi:hypothetical protein
MADEAHDERYLRGRHLASVLNERYRDVYVRDSNIIGSAYGRRIVGGEVSDVPAIVIYVARKVPAEFLPPSRMLPRRLHVGSDWIDVDVFETGPIYPHSFTGRDRPAPSGISIGRFADSPIDAGTLGALVTDLQAKGEGNPAILSCNHVLANENAGNSGDVIVQPGAIDGGNSPGDNIATLTRFVTINATGNVVDCAIATVDDPALVVNQMKNNLMPVPTKDHPAVGLLFAGGCNRTFMNPITSVLSQLNVQFISGTDATIAPTVGMNVEKVGRTTEYTTSTILEVDASLTASYNFGPGAFVNQIATAWMSSPGDSGSVICRGGQGGNVDNCSSGGCGSTSAAQSFLGVDLKLDAAIEKDFRERYLQHTRVGRFLIDVYFRHEGTIVGRVRDVQVTQEDRERLRALYHKYIERIRMGLLQPEHGNAHFTREQIREIRDLLERAKKYMYADEAQAVDELFKVLAPHLRNKTVRQILNSLNDDTLLGHIRRIISRVDALRQRDDD